MGIREAANRRPGVVAGIAIVAIIGALCMLWYSFGGKRAYNRTTAYFSDDDGASFYKDSADLVVPYTKDGKEVVRAGVMYCPDKGKYVAFLQRYTPAAREALLDAEQAKKEGRPPKNPGMVAMAKQIGLEFKKPGAGNPWVGGPTAGAVLEVPVLCSNQEPAELAVP